MRKGPNDVRSCSALWFRIGRAKTAAAARAALAVRAISRWGVMLVLFSKEGDPPYMVISRRPNNGAAPHCEVAQAMVLGTLDGQMAGIVEAQDLDPVRVDHDLVQGAGVLDDLPIGGQRLVEEL